ncbi:carboxypeptidase-like regulatory domain-containing protein [Ulvibacterium sp.]|uniref:carboxypeptidase-like regulatory domain-containing protein n=1 Tax=Ulvibacterium sp. TaxID=2665914 RepID=UPI002632C074|nr:carboxypeptidase-like regulatory domain-containing protein [Ulvibacterium sp.]
MNSLNLNHIVFILLFFVSFETFAQRQDYIIGRLLDSQSNEPVVFANIRIKDRALGVITNVDGSFRIPLKYREYGNIIEISSMGYKTKEIPITDFSQSELNVVSLIPAVFGLDEAVVKAKGRRKRNLNAKQIVQRAIDAIPRNFPSNYFSSIGYYRDYQLNDDQQYVNLNEAILEVFDQGFNQLDDATSETSLFHFGLNDNFEQDSLARASYDYGSLRKIIKKAHLDAYGGNEFRILRIHDAIRNYNVGSYDFIGTLKTDLIENHYFLRGSDTSIDTEEIYTIKFWVFYPNYRANGTIYISKLDFAIHKLEYTMYDEKKRNKTGKMNKHGNNQKVIFDITTDYRRIHNKMYLNYISFYNSFTLNIPPVFKVEYITYNIARNCFMVEYNTIPNAEQSVHLPNYKVEFKKKRVKLKSAGRSENLIFLFPKMEKEKIMAMTGEIMKAEKMGTDLNDLFSIKVANVRDTLGNLVNKWTQRDYKQFREFFVQRVRLGQTAPKDSLFMNKCKPIFENQPIARPDNVEDYWMNTPLGKID